MMLLLPPVCFVLLRSIRIRVCVLIVASCAQTFLAINPILCCCCCCCIHSTQTGCGRRFSGTCRSVCVSTTSISKAKTKTSIIIMDFGKMATTVGDAQHNKTQHSECSNGTQRTKVDCQLFYIMPYVWLSCVGIASFYFYLACIATSNCVDLRHRIACNAIVYQR